MILRTPSSMKVLEALEDGPATFSELVRRTGLPAHDVAGALDQLGRKGLVVAALKGMVLGEWITMFIAIFMKVVGG